MRAADQAFVSGLHVTALSAAAALAVMAVVATVLLRDVPADAVVHEEPADDADDPARTAEPALAAV